MRKREIKLGQKVKILKGNPGQIDWVSTQERPYWGRVGVIGKLDPDFDDFVWASVSGLDEIVWHYKELQKRWAKT